MRKLTPMMAKSNPVIRTLPGMPYHTLYDFFQVHGVPAQTFPIDARRRTTVVGEKGTRLTFFPDSFVDEEGKPLENEVIIHLREVFSRAEMVRSGLFSTAEDQLLESAGQIFLDARCEDKTVRLNHPASVEWPVDRRLHNPVGARLFIRGLSDTWSFRSQSRHDWKQYDGQPLRLISQNKKKYWHFLLPALNGWNCNAPFPVKRKSRTMVTVKWRSDVEHFDDLAAFLVFRDLMAVSRMYTGSHGFSAINIPQKLAATAVVFGLSGGHLFFGMTHIPQTSSQPFQVDLSTWKEEMILEMIETLG